MLFLHVTTLGNLSDFTIWFFIGLQHIADWNAYDHMLFLWALCGVYELSQWRQVLILVTAFTIGHSITLALSTFHFIQINTALVEVLIPLSIIFTALYHLRFVAKVGTHFYKVQYAMALVFGLIHGLGFSVLLKSLLGTTDSILLPLFSFNVGLEAGQIIIIASILFITMFISKMGANKIRYKKQILLLGVVLVATIMSVERIKLLLLK